jgi:dienelactone hydrolase
MFNSTPSATDIDQPSNATTTFLATHAENPTDAIIDVAVRYMRETLGVKRIGVTGYCFGGKYAFRYVATGKGADAAFAAHPSNLLDAEISAIKGPASVAAAGKSHFRVPYSGEGGKVRGCLTGTLTASEKPITR